MARKLKGYLDAEDEKYLKSIESWDLLDAITALAGFSIQYESFFVHEFGILEDEDLNLAVEFFTGDSHSYILQDTQFYIRIRDLKVVPRIFKAMKEDFINGASLKTYQEKKVDIDEGEFYQSLIPELVREDDSYACYYVQCFKPQDVIAWAISKKVVKVDLAFAVKLNKDGSYSWAEDAEESNSEAQETKPLSIGSQNKNIIHIDLDHPDLSEELKIALQAWDDIYARGERNDKLGHIDNIKAWLKKHHPSLSKNAKDRISTVINPNKSGGVPSPSRE